MSLRLVFIIELKHSIGVSWGCLDGMKINQTNKALSCQWAWVKTVLWQNVLPNKNKTRKWGLVKRKRAISALACATWLSWSYLSPDSLVQDTHWASVPYPGWDLQLVAGKRALCRALLRTGETASSPAAPGRKTICLMIPGAPPLLSNNNSRTQRVNVTTHYAYPSSGAWEM